jgi:putative nucleotidyltransferase with HDIG domain
MKRQGATQENKRLAQGYQLVVTAAGIGLWFMACERIALACSLRDQLTLMGMIPVIVVVGMFSMHYRLPMGAKFMQEELTFTLSDAIVLLVACWIGIFPAIFIAGLEGFTSSLRNSRRVSTHLFSSAIMSLGAAITAATLAGVLRFVFDEKSTGGSSPFLAVAIAMLVASIVQIVANLVLLTTLIALRHGNPILSQWKSFLWTVPLSLPTSTAASAMYVAFQYNPLVTAVVGAPILFSIYFGHRQYQDSVKKRIAFMEKAHRETIEALAVAINAKDEVTHEHVLRVQIYAAGVARLLGCSELDVEALRAGALLHDIGKIAVPDYILNKPGKLTAIEFEKMKMHTIAGAQILSRVEFPYPIVPVVRHHHERWDGKGYPDGLREEAIPLTARILSVVDCFDAVREDRQYRKGLKREEAIDLIMQGSGTQYDPRVVGTFIAHLPEFEAEIRAHSDKPRPNYGIEPTEQLSDAARSVPPAAGLAEEARTDQARVGHDEVKALCDLAQAVIRARHPEEVLGAFADKLKSVVPYDTCAITLINQESGETMVTYAAGEHATLLKGRRVAMGEGVTGWVLANRKPFSNTDPKLDFSSDLASQFEAYRTMAAFPVMRDRQRFGAVTLYSASFSVYTADQLRLIEEAVAMLAAALSSNLEAALPEMREERASQAEQASVASRNLAIALVESEFKN